MSVIVSYNHCRQVVNFLGLQKKMFKVPGKTLNIVSTFSRVSCQVKTFAAVFETVKSDRLDRGFTTTSYKIIFPRTTLTDYCYKTSSRRPEKLLTKGLEHKETNTQHLSHRKLNQVMCPWIHWVLLAQETEASCLRVNSLKNKAIPVQGKEINLRVRSTRSASCIQGAKTKQAKRELFTTM